jgi:eukaryotic-like serine/threonine-protein kinase
MRQRSPQQARRLAREGDAAYREMDAGRAANKYREAFQLDPTPELALKLGEIYWQRQETEEARGWWRRHLKDTPGSAAREYIATRFPDLVAALPR